MILPADKRLKTIVSIYEEIYSLYREISSLPYETSDVGSFTNSLKKREEIMNFINEKSKIIDIEKSQFLKDSSLESFTYKHLSNYDKTLSSNLKNIIKNIELEIQKIESYRPKIISMLKEFQNSSLKEIAMITNGKKIANSYTQKNICESRFIDQKK